jgi:hypothetical protein
MNREQKEIQEAIHRMNMIIDDANVVLDHFKRGKGISDPTKCADNVHTHLSNIEIAIDLNDNECLTWKKFTK